MENYFCKTCGKEIKFYFITDKMKESGNFYCSDHVVIDDKDRGWFNKISNALFGMSYDTIEKVIKDKNN